MIKFDSTIGRFVFNLVVFVVYSCISWQIVYVVISVPAFVILLCVVKCLLGHSRLYVRVGQECLQYWKLSVAKHFIEQLFYKYYYFLVSKWERDVALWESVCSRYDGLSDRSLRVVPLSYFLFHPELHDWCNKGHGMCYPICEIVHIKEPLLLIKK